MPPHDFSEELRLAAVLKHPACARRVLAEGDGAIEALFPSEVPKRIVRYVLYPSHGLDMTGHEQDFHLWMEATAVLCEDPDYAMCIVERGIAHRMARYRYQQAVAKTMVDRYVAVCRYAGNVLAGLEPTTP